MIKVEDYVKLRAKLLRHETRAMIGLGLGILGIGTLLPGSIFAWHSSKWATSMGNTPKIMVFIGVGLLLVSAVIFVRQSKIGRAVNLESKEFYSSITDKYGFTLAPGEKITLGEPTAFKDGEPVQVLSTFKGDKTLSSIAVFVEGDEFAFYSSEGQKLSLLVGDTEKR